MDNELWVGYDVSYSAIWCEESSRRIWEEIETFFGDEFRAHVNGITEEDCARTSF